MDEAQVQSLQDAADRAYTDFENAETALDNARATLDAAMLEQGEAYARQHGVWVGQTRIYKKVMHWNVEKIEYNPVSKVYWVHFYIFGVFNLEDVLRFSTPLEAREVQK